MYADREEAASATRGTGSVAGRLNFGGGGRVESLSSSGRNVTGKRQRQDDDKWEHDLFTGDENRVSSSKIGTRDLRLKLQRKNTQSSIQTGNVLNSGGVRDLREKLSGTMHSQPLNNDLPKAKVADAHRPVKKAVDATPETETKKVARPPSKKSKADAVVDSFLQSLGLEKYVITFKAEEIDMTALVHMSDDDLKALGIPMVEWSLHYVPVRLEALLRRMLLSSQIGSKKENTYGVGFSGLNSMDKWRGGYKEHMVKDLLANEKQLLTYHQRHGGYGA